MTINKCQVPPQVRPGDTLEYHVDKVANRRNIWWYRGEAKAGSVLVAEAELGAYLTDGCLAVTVSSSRSLEAPDSKALPHKHRLSRPVEPR